MTGDEDRLREQVAAYARRLHARGWVANHDGNVTARLDDERLLATPGARSKEVTAPDQLLLLDLEGHVLDAPPGLKPFSEIGLHLTAYAARPDVRAVIHAHPPSATAFACAGRALPAPFIAEAVVSLGPSIPLVPFAPPGPSACAALRPHLDSDVLVLQSHGTLALGADVEQAYLRTELTEHLACIALAAAAIGGVQPLDATVLPALLEARRKAGLGPEARAAQLAPGEPAPPPPVMPATVVACGPAPPGATVATIEPGASSRGTSPAATDLAALIREEIARALRGA